MITDLGDHASFPWSTNGQQTSRLKPPTDTPGRLRMRMAWAAIVTDQERQVRAYAAEVVPGCSVDRVTDVNRFEAGENHEVTRCHT